MLRAEMSSYPDASLLPAFRCGFSEMMARLLPLGGASPVSFRPRRSSTGPFAFSMQRQQIACSSIGGDSASKPPRSILIELARPILVARAASDIVLWGKDQHERRWYRKTGGLRQNGDARALVCDVAGRHLPTGGLGGGVGRCCRSLIRCASGSPTAAGRRAAARRRRRAARCP